MIKKYLVFAWDYYDPSGGWHDFQESFDSLSDARRYVEELNDFDMAQIVDSTNGKCCHYACPGYGKKMKVVGKDELQTIMGFPLQFSDSVPKFPEELKTMKFGTFGSLTPEQQKSVSELYEHTVAYLNDYQEIKIPDSLLATDNANLCGDCDAEVLKEAEDIAEGRKRFDFPTVINAYGQKELSVADMTAHQEMVCRKVIQLLNKKDGQF